MTPEAMSGLSEALMARPKATVHGLWQSEQVWAWSSRLIVGFGAFVGFLKFGLSLSELAVSRLYIGMSIDDNCPFSCVQAACTSLQPKVAEALGPKASKPSIWGTYIEGLTIVFRTPRIKFRFSLIHKA